jgi:hypothetical protein
MYFIFYFLIVILILLFIIIQFFNVFSQPHSNGYKKYLNILIFLIVLTTVGASIINIYSINKNHNKIGQIGDRGIEGEQGKDGTAGRCDVKCGQKVCYLNVVEHANKILRKEIKEISKSKNLDSKIEIKNKYLLKKLNTICNSDNYFATLTKQHKKKPTEEKLINFIKDIVSKWILLIINGDRDNITKSRWLNNRGYIFLTTKNYKFEFLDSYSPFILKELKKYDIFNWGDTTIIKRKVYTIKSDTLKHPEPDESRLYIIKTNNYEPIYNAKSKKDIWDVTNCPYNQLGIKQDNPDNLKKCIYIDKNTYKKSYQNTWKKTEYDVPQELSIYNAISYKNKNGQKFYPVGSVWRGKNSYDKPNHAVNTPESSSFCGDGQGLGNDKQHNNKGPEKETILVSGDVKEPINYELIWSSKIKCPECQIDHVLIFRPIAPKDYVALGDVAVKYDIKWKTNDPTTTKALNDMLQIRCIPKECVRDDIKIGDKVWDNQAFRYNQYSKYLNYTSKIAYKNNTQSAISLWDAGNSNSGEEIHNNYGVHLEENGGYNLFRASRGYNLKPILNIYTIKQKYLQIGEGKSPKKIDFNLKQITNTEADARYKTSDYFGKKPSMAIITNIDKTLDENTESLINNINNPKRFYLVDDNVPRHNSEPDTFLIKTFNSEKNDYSSCLTYNSNHEVIIKPYCKLNSDYNKWKVSYDEAEKTAKLNCKISIHPKKYPKKQLKNYYDENGKNINTLPEFDASNSDRLWWYETPTAQELPKK